MGWHQWGVPVWGRAGGWPCAGDQGRGGVPVQREAGAWGPLYGEVQRIMSNGHMGPVVDRHK